MATIECCVGQEVSFTWKNDRAHVVRINPSLDAANGTLIAGESGVAGAWSYQFSNPTSITFDRFGSMYIMDSGNNRIQRWSPGSTYGVTVASASMSNPRGLSFDTYGNLVVADMSNHRIVSFPVSCREYLTFFIKVFLV